MSASSRKSHTRKTKGAVKKGVTRKKTSTRAKSSSSTTHNPLHLVEFRVLARIAIALIFVGILYWIAHVPTQPPANQQQSAATSTKKPTQQKPSNLSGLSYDDFTFYSSLPEFEIKVAKDNPYAQNNRPQAVNYLIQAGAFKTHERAEKLLVELTLLDLEPRIEQQGKWFRILIGPIKSRSQMSAIRNRLIENGIRAQVLKQKTS